jgi:hypothetical protein
LETTCTLDSGFNQQQALGVTMKTLSNFAHHLTSARTSEEFLAFTWKGPV